MIKHDMKLNNLTEMQNTLHKKIRETKNSWSLIFANFARRTIGDKFGGDLAKTIIIIALLMKNENSRTLNLVKRPQIRNSRKFRHAKIIPTPYYQLIIILCITSLCIYMRNHISNTVKLKYYYLNRCDYVDHRFSILKSPQAVLILYWSCWSEN